MLRGFSIVAALSLALNMIAEPAAAQRVLRLTLQLPITNVLGQNVSAFKRFVERESGGGIVIDIHPSAELFVDAEVPGAVSKGAVEMGVVSLTRYAPIRPAIGLIDLPFLFNDTETVETVTGPGHPIRTALDKEILATGARPLWWQPFGMAIMLGRDQAPTRPELLKSRKTRVFGTTMQKFVAAMGGHPVAISGSKQFDAYKRGEVDFGMTGVTAVKSRKLHDVMHHLVTTNHAALEFVVVINEAVWRRLSDRDRSLLGTAAVTVEQDLRLSYRDTHRDTLAWIAANTSMKVSDLDSGERAAWRHAARPIYDSYVREAGTTGAKLLSEARKLH